MSDLETLKAQHPCIEGVLKVYADAGPDGCSQRERAMVELVTTLQQHEATIADKNDYIGDLNDELRSVKERAAYDRRRYEAIINQIVSPSAEIIRLMPPPPMYLSESQSVNALTLINEQLKSELAAAQATIQQRERELEEAQQIMGALLFPNVPSADDVALLVRMTSGSSDRADGAMLLVEALRAAQGKARVFLVRHSARAQQESEAKKEQK